MEFDDIPDPLADAAAPVTIARATLSARPAPARAETRTGRLVALGVSLAWLGMHLAVYGVRADLGALPLLYVSTQMLLPGLLALLALALTLTAGKLGLGPNLGVAGTVAILGPLSFVLMAVGAPAPRPVPGDGAFWVNAFVCLDITLAWAAVPLVAAALAFRRAFVVGAGVRAALVGAACGLLAGATMNLHCPSVDPFHMAFGHGIPVVVATVLGAIVLVRWVRV